MNAVLIAVVVFAVGAFLIVGVVKPSDVIEPLRPSWVTTSNVYEFDRYVYTTSYTTGSGKSRHTHTTLHTGTRWEWRGGYERRGAGWTPEFARAESRLNRAPVVGDRETRNDEIAYYINGLCIGSNPADFAKFNGREIDRVVIHTNRFGWRTVRPLLMEKPDGKPPTIEKGG
ncbi:MAG TPA: hypothetical protein VGE52_01510 [Pirellulales bacterium]